MVDGNERYDTIYRDLRDKGACAICSCRFLDKSEWQESCKKHDFSIPKETEKSDDERLKTEEYNTCVICFGLFDENVTESVKEQILANEVLDFESDHFMIALTLPSNCHARERILCEYLRSKFPESYDENSFLPYIGIKEAWRFHICPSLSKIFDKTYNTKSDLIIQVIFTYDGDDMRSDNYFEMENCRSAINESVVKIKNHSNCLNSNLRIPNGTMRCESVSVRRDSFFVAGRYNKFSRLLSQTPWIFADGERKMETSVEEIISENLKKLTKAQGSRFSSSGREDIDVRMLGNGRPFAVELINAKFSNISFSAVRMVENEINNVDSRSVLVRDLQIVHRSNMRYLKIGEESKTKDYCAVCLVKKAFTLQDVVKKLPVTPFHIQQKTPLRVLHRRTVATRHRTIHEMKVHVLKTDNHNGETLIKLNVTTQAGTYVKEFIHGDFGRTFPSISFMFDQVPVDVLALDVMNVEADWPIPLSYEKEIR